MARRTDPDPDPDDGDLDPLEVDELAPGSLLEAYRHGYFPMGDAADEEIRWYRPDPRAIIPLDGLHVPRRLARRRRQGRWRTSCDEAFADVMQGCAAGRPVWITDRIHRAYRRLHRAGHAHSVEVWSGRSLVGGLYGVQVGGAFMAESKFHRETDASKLALWVLVERLRERGFRLLEVQFLTPHLERLGAVEISLHEYLLRLEEAAALDRVFAP